MMEVTIVAEPNNNNNNNSDDDENNNNNMGAEKENIGSKIDNPYFLRFLLYFLISIIVVGVLVGLVFVLQQNNAINKQNQVLAKLNQTFAAVNFTQTQIHEDNARENQTAKENKFEMAGRNNQTRTLINYTREEIKMHHDALMEFIKQQNATFVRILTEIFNTQDQNDQILKVQKNVSLANRELLKAGIDKIGLNSTEILEDYNNTSKDTIDIGNSTKN
jgi:hypothetical protein